MNALESSEQRRTLVLIAREHLGLETLETRNADALDFSDQAVSSLRAALEAAYAAGRASVPAPVLGLDDAIASLEEVDRQAVRKSTGAGWWKIPNVTVLQVRSALAKIKGATP